jgi:acetolactate synthase-1/2/3 large subunit
MGFSLPAAMGAAFAGGPLPVISISGDGGFQMNMQELATIVEHKLPLKIIIINNGFLGMVRQWQELFWRGRYSQVQLANPDFVKLAEAFGCPASRVTRSDEVEDALKTLLAHSGGPILLECRVAKEDNVYPMIPAGQSVEEMLDVPDPAAPIGGADPQQVIVLHKGSRSTIQHTSHDTVPAPAK